MARRWKRYSERWFLKYLVSNHGVCFGVDMKDRSYLLLVSARGLVWQRRPVGDKVVENLDYEIPAIVRALDAERVAPS
jgi:hypothetical protein